MNRYADWMVMRAMRESRKHWPEKSAMSANQWELQQQRPETPEGRTNLPAPFAQELPARSFSEEH